MPGTSPFVLGLLAAMAFGLGLASARDRSAAVASQSAGTGGPPSQSTGDVLATVNGTPIREADVRFALSSGGHDQETTPEHAKNVLEVIIRQELIKQGAIRLGLDTNAAYQERLRRMEAQIDAFKREELSRLFWRDVARRAEVSETEAEDYFAANAARIRTELHVWQILSRRESSIRKAREAIDQGASFEEVAAGRFPKLPKTGRAPWDLGYLKWKQIPEPWRDVVYDLKEGQVSGVICGPNNRFWIIKLVEKRENLDVTFESIKPAVIELLKNEKIEKLHKEIEEDLRAKASVEYLHDPVAPPGE